MRKNIPAYLLIPLITGVVGTLIFIIPVIGPVLSLPILPLLEMYDGIIPGNFVQTGTHVDIGFLWITLKTPQAWLFYVSFFALPGIPLGLLTHFLSHQKVKTIPNISKVKTS